MKHIIITERDNNILSFLNEFRCATTNTITQLFFNGSTRSCSRRLQNLREHKYINSSQSHISLQQVHYVGKKPMQITHSCLCTNLLARLKEQGIEVIKSKIEYKVGNVRADMLLVLKIHDKHYIYLVEVCNTKKFDVNKYIKLYEDGKYKDVFPVFPNILVVSNKEVEVYSKFNITVLKQDMQNIQLGG